MKLNLKRQISKLSAKTSFETVLSEALTNSIHANAQEITVTLERARDLFSDSPDPDSDPGDFIQSIQIEDNGDGFTDQNRTSFGEYGSEFKAELGCKGVGRLVFLKVFSSVRIESKAEDGSVDFLFTDTFSEEDISVTKEKNEEKWTKITMSNPVAAYQASLVDFDQLISSLKFHLMPLLFLTGKRMPVQILFQDEEQKSLGRISTDDVPEFNEVSFTLQENHTKDKKKVQFTLSYHIEKVADKSVLEAHYVANNLTVARFNKYGLPLSPREDSEIIFLLSSSYFDERVNDPRDGLDIYPKKEDFVSYFSWARINAELSKCLTDILNESFDGLETQHQDFVEEVTRKNLHLAKYLQLNPLSGTEGVKRAVRQAGREYLQDKTDFVENLEAGNITPEEAMEKASEFSGRELIEYVQMRDRIITELEKMSTSGEEREAIIHNHICPRGESGGFIDPRKNNLWLIDDRFMGYSYAALDKQIRKVLEDIVGKEESGDSSKEPDFSVFFRNDEDVHNGVIIELKPFDNDAKKKFAGLFQLRTYAKEFQEKKGLEQIWYYLITDIDPEFEEALIGDDYSPLFSTKEKIYFRYFQKLGLYLYVLSSESLVADARARNRTFIDLLEKNLPK